MIKIDMHWIYLSPHLDDVALSLGGLLWEQVQAGEQVSIWTLCAGDPPAGPFSTFAESLHQRWGVGREAIAARRAEDIYSCELLGVGYRHFEIPDCIYRRSPVNGRYLYDSEEALWIPVHPDESPLVERVAAILRTACTEGVRLICPWGLGEHIDHRLTRSAAEQVSENLWFYADYPYVLEAPLAWQPAGLLPVTYAISPAGLAAWQDAVAAHHSQISTFWSDLAEMRLAIRTFQRQMNGAKLWHRSVCAQE